MALYPFKNSKELYETNPDDFNIPVLLYKMCQKLEKAHAKGIIHNDIKLANILVTIENPDMAQFFDVKLIDWNLASFYYPGYASNGLKGTPCYFSPEQLFNVKHITPATDVYTLGMTMFYFLAQKKPFRVKCSARNDNNIQSIASFVGYEAIKKVSLKYGYNIGGNMYKHFEIMEKHPKNFTKVGLQTLIPKEYLHRFTPQLI